MEPCIQFANKHMHIFQAVDKIGMFIEVCAFQLDTSYMLRHAVEIIGGFYLGTSDFEGLCMNLLCQLLMSPQRLYHLNYPKQAPMDLCNKLIKIGFACSNCLSGEVSVYKLKLYYLPTLASTRLFAVTASEFYEYLYFIHFLPLQKLYNKLNHIAISVIRYNIIETIISLIWVLSGGCEPPFNRPVSISNFQFLL